MKEPRTTMHQRVAELTEPGTQRAVQERLAYDRTHLANERTFAAWLRTGLSVAAGGIAVAHLVPEPSRDSVEALTLGAAFVLLGVAIMTYGARQAAAVAERLAREGHDVRPRSARSLYVVTGLVSLLLVTVLLFLWTHQGRPAFRAAESGSATTTAIRR
jgi:putative membrane protein